MIVDFFGSQVTKLIARRVRDLGAYSEVLTPNQIRNIKNFKEIKGIILSGGPSSVTQKNFQSIPRKIFFKNIPILGVCYGLQLIAKLFGGRIKSSKKKREFVRALIFKKNDSLLTKNFFISNNSVWIVMRCCYKITKNFRIIASTKNSKLTIIENSKKKFMEFSFIQK